MSSPLPIPSSLTPRVESGSSLERADFGALFTPRAGEPTFSDTLRGMVGDVSQMQDQAKSAIEAFVRGEPVDIHQVMIAAEEASMSLELLVELRNKLIDAYRTLTNLQ